MPQGTKEAKKSQDVEKKTELKQVKPAKSNKAKVADSWEDEMSAEEEGTTSETEEPNFESISSSSFSAPTSRRTAEDDFIPMYSPASHGSYSATSVRPSELGRRPEKQTAVAGRLIAGALGVRVPKKTDEQRAYDKAAKENEMRRRNREREAELAAQKEAERAKAAIWDN